MTTGERIKAARKAANMTQRELGTKLGITYQTVAQWENDLRHPKRETLQKIADALDCDYIELSSDKTISWQDFTGWHDDDLHAFFFGSTAKKKLLDLLLHRSEDESKNIERVFASMDRLNDDGQAVAVERVEELTEIPKYQREEAPPAPAEEPTEDK